MDAKVVTTFKDKEHQRVYRVGDSYPAEGFMADEERIEFLSKPHPQTKKVYLFVEKKEEDPIIQTQIPEDTTEKQSADTPPMNEDTPVITEPKKKTTPRKKPTTEVGE